MTKHETPVAEPSAKEVAGPKGVTFAMPSYLGSPPPSIVAEYQRAFESMRQGRWPDPMLDPPDAGHAPVSLRLQLARLLDGLGTATRHDPLIAAGFNEIVMAGCGHATCEKCEKHAIKAVVRLVGELIRDRERLQAMLTRNPYRYVSQEFDAKAAKNPLPMKPDPVLKEIADANGGFIPVPTGMVYGMNRREAEAFLGIDPKTATPQKIEEEERLDAPKPSYVPAEIVEACKVAIATRERSPQTQANIDKMKEQMKKGSLPEPETGVYTPRPPCKLRHGPFTNGLCDKCGQPEYPSW